MVSKTDRIIKQFISKPQPQTPIASAGEEGIYLPNHSGIAVHPEAKKTFVNKSGDTMTGALDMGLNTIKGLANGTNSGDAVNKSQLDNKPDNLGDLADVYLEDLGGSEIIYYSADDDLFISLPPGGGGFLKVNPGDLSMEYTYPTFSEISNVNAWKIGDCDAVQVSHTGTTTETIVKTFTIPANTLGANGGLRLVWFTHSDGSAGNKIWRLRFGTTGTSSTQIFYQAVSAGNDATFGYREIWNRNSASSQICWSGSSVFTGTGSSAPVTTSVNTAATSYIYLTCQLANSAETAYLEHYCLEWNKGTEAYT